MDKSWINCAARYNTIVSQILEDRNLLGRSKCWLNGNFDFSGISRNRCWRKACQLVHTLHNQWPKCPWMLCYFGSPIRMYFVNKCNSGYASQICEMCQPNIMVVWTLSLFGCCAVFDVLAAMYCWSGAISKAQTIMAPVNIFWAIYIVWWSMCVRYVCFYLVKSILSNAQCDLVWFWLMLT
jgi:hypothetical protein